MYQNQQTLVHGQSCIKKMFVLLCGQETATHGKFDLPLHISISETFQHATFHTKHLMTKAPEHFKYYTTFQDGCELKKQMEYFSQWT